MDKLATTLTLLLLLAVTNANHLEDYDDFQQIMKILSKPRILERNLYSSKVLNETGMVKGIRWNNCGPSSDPLRIKSLIIRPDPISVSHPVTVSFSVVVSSDLTAPIKVELSVKKKVLFWIDIPCTHDVGSCTYHNICKRLSTITCPEQFKKAGLPCQCPIKKGTYKLQEVTVTIPKVSMPSWLMDGDYQITAKLSSNHQHLGCVHLQLSLSK